MDQEDTQPIFYRCPSCAAQIRIGESALRCIKCAAILCPACVDPHGKCPRCGGKVHRYGRTVTAVVTGDSAEDVAKVVGAFYSEANTPGKKSESGGIKWRELFVTESLKTASVIIAGIVVAALLLWLGLK